MCLTCGHEKWNAKLPAEHPCAQILQRAPVEGQSAADQHVQHHTETLHPNPRSRQQQRERPREVVVNSSKRCLNKIENKKEQILGKDLVMSQSQASLISLLQA